MPGRIKLPDRRHRPKVTLLLGRAVDGRGGEWWHVDLRDTWGLCNDRDHPLLSLAQSLYNIRERRVRAAGDASLYWVRLPVCLETCYEWAQLFRFKLPQEFYDLANQYAKEKSHTFSWMTPPKPAQRFRARLTITPTRVPQ